MNKTIISWTKHTWNPVHGCSVVSDGCRHCYAEQLSLRYGWTKKAWTGANASENVQLKPHKLSEPYKIKEPARIFVNSMSDCFHPLVTDAYLEKIFEVMHNCPQHTFQILTKRPERAARWGEWGGMWTSNIWMGTSVEDARVKHRIDTLRGCGAQTRFISAEPLIGDLGDLELVGIDWVIVGGESGNHMRPDNGRWMQQAWARNIKRQCVEQGVAFFYKQDSGTRTEMRPYLVEEDGSHWQWQQWPNQMTPPINLTVPIQGQVPFSTLAQQLLLPL